MTLREPARSEVGREAGGVVDTALPADGVRWAPGGGRVPTVLHDSTSPRGKPTASELAYGETAKFVPLPGRMYTVTLYDAKQNRLATRTEPLYDDIDGDLFFGTIDKAGRIAWADEGVEVELAMRVGTKLDKNGAPIGGSPIEKWAQTAGHGKAATILVELDAATMQETENPPLYALGDPASDSTQTSAGSAAVAQAATRGDGTGAGGAGVDGRGGTSEQDRVGTTTERGHSGKSTATTPARGSTDSTAGSERGTSTSGAGGTRGRADGTKTEVNYFYDPDQADKGNDDTAPEGGVVGGMVGGKPYSTDEGIPQGGWFELVSVPRNIAPAVAAGLILLDADIAGLGVDVIKVSIRLGRKAAGKAGALAKVISQKVARYADGEAAKIAEVLSRDATFMAKTGAEQTAIIQEVREGIIEETNRRLAAELDAQIIEAEKALKLDRTRTDEFADHFVENDLANLEAARNARASLAEVQETPKLAPDEVVTDGTMRPALADKQEKAVAAKPGDKPAGPKKPKTIASGWNDVPADLRSEVSTALDDVRAAEKGDTAARQRINQRNPHVLTANYDGWTSLDIYGRANPFRILYKVESDGSINWMVLDTHH